MYFVTVSIPIRFMETVDCKTTDDASLQYPTCCLDHCQSKDIVRYKEDCLLLVVHEKRRNQRKMEEFCEAVTVHDEWWKVYNM